jgi:hypothetical protein
LATRAVFLTTGIVINILKDPKSVNAPFEKFLINTFYNHLYSKPACTDELGLLSHHKKSSAVSFNYIQHNNPNSVYWLVFDVDRPSAHFDFIDYHAPPPNMAVMNPDNGHCHLLYGLDLPVHKNFSSNTAPLKYAADIERALLFTLQSDPNYSNFLCQNPMSTHWIVYFYQHFLYTLEWLADYLDLKRFKLPKKNVSNSGLGRNCCLFDTVRPWAYSKIRDNALNMSLSAFQTAVIGFTDVLNNQLFTNPLPNQEVKSIGKSIATWTWRHLSDKGFSDYQRRAALRGRAIATKKAESRDIQIRMFKGNNPAMSNRAIAKVFKVNEKTVRSALKNKSNLLF